MKRLIPCFVILLCLIGTLVFGNHVIKSGCAKTHKKLYKCEAYFNNKDFEKAFEMAKQLQKEWEETKKLLAAFVNHSALDSISENLSQLPHLADENTQFIGLSKISETKYLLEFIVIHQDLTSESFY